MLLAWLWHKQILQELRWDGFDGNMYNRNEENIVMLLYHEVYGIERTNAPANLYVQQAERWVACYIFQLWESFICFVHPS